MSAGPDYERSARDWLEWIGATPNREGLRSLTMSELGKLLYIAHGRGWISGRRYERPRAFAIGRRRGWRDRGTE